MASSAKFSFANSQNALKLLHSGRGKPDLSSLLSAEDVAHLAVERWMLPRSQRRPEFKIWKRENIAALLGNQGASFSLSCPKRSRRNASSADSLATSHTEAKISMPTPLDEWQQRLESHFEQLAAARAYSDFPLFALEHGLTEDEFDEITHLLHAQLTDGWRLGRHWLVWVVYATELGYDYDGDEYWLSFEQRTPLWRAGDHTHSAATNSAHGLPNFIRPTRV